MGGELLKNWLELKPASYLNDSRLMDRSYEADRREVVEVRTRIAIVRVVDNIDELAAQR